MKYVPLSIFTACFFTFTALYRHDLIKLHTGNARHLCPRCSDGALEWRAREVPHPKQQAGENLHQICNWDPHLVFYQLFLLISNLKPSLDSIFFKTEARGKTVWKVTSWATKGSSAPFSGLVTGICTYRQGLKFCFFAASSSRLREGAAGWWPAAGYVLNSNPPAKQGDEPWWESPWAFSRSRESSEQHEALSNIGGQRQKEETASGLHGFPVMSVGWCFYTFLLELVLFFLPRQVARRVTSELAADVRSHRSY